jgi:hypothetical protein
MYCIQRYGTASSAAPSDSTVSEDDGIEPPGLLRPRHGQSDALTTRLDLMSLFRIHRIRKLFGASQIRSYLHGPRSLLQQAKVKKNPYIYSFLTSS